MNTALPTPKSLTFLYFRYKDSPVFALSLVGIALMVSLILVLKILLPQLNDWFSIQQEVNATRQQIQTLNNNIDFIGSYNDTTLDQSLQTVSTALPSEKNFIGILNAISDSAVKSNVLVNDYTFNLGVISGSQLGVVSQAVSPTQITIVVEGGLSDVTFFIKQIEEKTPLAKVESLSFSHESATLILTYYYKPFPNISYDDTAALHPFPQSTTDLIKQLDSWKATETILTSPAQTASASADPF